jgi:hypothetical protein
VSPDEAMGLHQERPKQRNEAPEGAGFRAQVRNSPGSHKPGECQLVGRLKTFESAIKIVIEDKRKWLV